MVNRQKSIEILYKRLFFAALPNKRLLLESFFTYFQQHLRICLDKPVFNNVDSIDHSSTINNTVKKNSNTFLHYSL